MIDAFHLPAIGSPPVAAWRAGEMEIPDLRTAVLDPELLRAQLSSLREAGELLARRPVAEIVTVIDGVAARLLDPADELRRTAESMLPRVTGSSAEMTSRVLDGMGADWRRPRLEELLRSELGDPAALDGFTTRGGESTRVRAMGPGLTLHFLSGNIPGIGVTSLIRALLVKSPSLAKSGAGEPVLPALFARGVAEADAELGRCLAVAYWQGGDAPLEQVALEMADAVIAYGGRRAIESIRERTPRDTIFLGYGQKLSFGLIARESLSAAGARAAAADAALAVAMFDQHGCVSPHLFYAESGGETAPSAWAGMLADELERLRTELPRGPLLAGESAAIVQTRGSSEFEALAGGEVEVHASPGGTDWTVIFSTDPAFEASCLNRVARVKAIDDIAHIAPLVRDVAPYLQTVGVAGPDGRIEPVAEALARAGASRIAPLANMPWPPPAWHHDGRPPLRDLLRWCDWE